VANCDLSKLTAIIRTFERPKSLRRLLKSLRRHVPELKTLVADDSIKSPGRNGPGYLRLPSEKGGAAALNALLARIRTPYFLLLDECTEWTADTELNPLFDLVAGDHLDIAAGTTITCRRKLWLIVKRTPQPTHGLFELAGDQLTLLPGHRSNGQGFQWCDFVGDCYLARTDKVRTLGGWDPELRDHYREEFFFRAHQKGLRVGVVPEVAFCQWIESPSDANGEKPRELRPLAVAKMGLAQMTTLEGRTFRAPRLARAA